MTDTDQDQSPPAQGSGGLNLPQIPAPNTMAPALTTGEAEAGITPNRWQQMKAILQEASDKAPIGFMPGQPGFLQRAAVQNSLAAQDQSAGVLKISPDEANQRYPGMPVPFNEPVDPYVADLQYNDFQHRQQLAEWKDRGGSLPWGVEGAVGIAGGVFDPLNLAMMTLAGPVSRVAGLSNSLKNTFLTNLAINASFGIPGYYQEKAEHQDVTATGAGAEIVGGAVGGTAFHYAMGAVGKLLGQGIDFLKRTPEDIQTNNLKTAIMQHEAGAVVDTTPGVNETQSRLNGDIQGGQDSFEFKPIEHPNDTSYFMARSSKGQNVEFAPLGPGTHAVDNSTIANNMVSNPEALYQGKLGEYIPSKGTKFLDLESPAGAPENKDLLSGIEEKLGSKLEVPEGETLKDVVQNLETQASIGKVPADILSQIQEVAKQQGYEGYKYVQQGINGEPQHNGIVMFDKDILPNRITDPDATSAPTQSSAAREAFNEASTGTKSSVDYSPQIDKEIRDFKHGPSFNSTPEYMDPIVQEQYAAAKAGLEAMVKQDPTLKEDVDQLKKQEATYKQEKQVLQDYADCMQDTMS